MRALQNRILHRIPNVRRATQRAGRKTEKKRSKRALVEFRERNEAVKVGFTHYEVHHGA